jgi:hypothetical protein
VASGQWSVELNGTKREDRSPASYRGHEQIIEINRKCPGDLAHANVGGVSTPARWQSGFGNAGRLRWPPPRRGGRANDNQGIDRIDCE